MKQIKAVIQPFMLEKVLEALGTIEDLPGVTISQVAGWGKTRAANVVNPVIEAGHAFGRKTKLEIVVPDEMVKRVVDLIVWQARTGRPGDGKVFISEVVDVLTVRTGAHEIEEE